VLAEQWKRRPLINNLNVEKRRRSFIERGSEKRQHLPFNRDIRGKKQKICHNKPCLEKSKEVISSLMKEGGMGEELKLQRSVMKIAPEETEKLPLPPHIKKRVVHLPITGAGERRPLKNAN